MRRVASLSLLLLFCVVGCEVGLSVVGSPRNDASVSGLDASSEDLPSLVVRDVADVPPPECRTDSECADGVACTADSCLEGRCLHAPSLALCPVGSSCDALRGCRPIRACADDAACQDGDACTVAERCDRTRRVCLFDEFPSDTPCGRSGSGQTCRGGACQCPADRPVLCADRCVDPQRESANCGACDNACAAGSWCQGGACACSAPQTYCPGVGCVDVTRDPNHCGACGRVCRGGDASVETCIAGACLAPCPAGTHRCGTTCASDASPATCGARCEPCVAPARGSAACAAGQCGVTCEAGLHACGSACLDAASLAGCGPSCVACIRPAHGTVACVSDACRVSCEPGYHACRGGCVPDASPLSCGASCEPCFVPPHGVATCAAGACGVACDVGYRSCAGTCSDGTSPLSCGASCTRCPVPVRGAATCVSGACGFTCDAGTHRCDAACLADVSPLSCGSSCAPCPAPDHGAATCAAGACGITCDPGYRATASGCVSLPRPLSPGSLVNVTVRRPTLRWSAPDGIPPVAVDLCRDRGCRTIVETLVGVSGRAATPTRDLPRGVIYWRVRAPDPWGSTTPWAFVVGGGAAASARVESTWGSLPDVNGDGYGDVVTVASEWRGCLFLGAATGLESTPRDVLSGPLLAQGFGESVATGDVNGDGFTDVIIAASRANAGRGMLVVYQGGPGGLGDPTLVASAAPAEGHFGSALAYAGDVDGDGYGDVLVGASAASPGGRAYLYRGGRAGLDPTLVTELVGPDGADSRFGGAVAGAGDVDADGFADVIVGADGTAREAGRVFMFRGGRAGLGTAVWVEPLSDVHGRLGKSVAGIGDVNGDGYPDVAVGEPNAEFMGRVLVFAGSATGVSAAPSQAIVSPGRMPGEFGGSVASAGDFDGDGFGDLAVGSPRFADDLGSVHLFLGSPGGLSLSPAATWVGTFEVGSSFGAALPAARDLDGDGFSDIVFGAERADRLTGVVLIVPGGSLTRVPRRISPPSSAIGNFGHAIAARFTARPTSGT